MKSKVLQRPMFMPPEEVENVGIMQGFMDDMEGIFEEEDDDEGEDYETGKMMGRTPDSPEIIMNNLRGDMRSVDARVEELADMVGYRAAVETPMEVLALLQPVLAGQGIAALPVGGAPGQAMPPMPPAPAAPQMQPAGAPPAMPAGGIASLPQGESAPLQMAKGGIVQYFQDGSDDEAVTPFPMSLTSSTRTVSEGLRNESENATAAFLKQAMQEVPTLQESMQGRLPMYEELLGTGDKDSMRAAMLFDIAQTALGYAGNVGPQGQPLRGSQAARLAGAASALPGQIGARLAAQQQQDQAVRLAALQAAEKDVQDIRGSNTALAKEQRALMSTISTSDTMGQSALTESKAWAAVNSLPRVILNGTATPEQIDLFATSMAMVTRNKEYVDPLTGQLVVSRAAVPAHAQDAAALLNQGASEREFRVPTGIGQTAQLGQTPEPLDQNVPPSALDPLVIANPKTENYGQANVANFYNAAGNATGIMPVVSAAVYKTPVLNYFSRNTAGQEVQAQAFVTLGINALVEAFNSNTARFTAEERRDLQKKLDLLPQLIATPEAYRATLFGLDDLLQIKQEAALRNYRSEGLNMDAKKAYQEQAVAINDARLLLGVPLHIDSPQDPRIVDIAARYPVGTEFLILNDPKTPGVPVSYTVNQEAKDEALRGRP